MLPMPAHLSVRAAPHLAGMGLLEAVPESELQTLANSSLIDPDGAVGRLQIVQDPRNPLINRVGRFGWRASSATVEDQIASALNNDIGVTTSLRPKHECRLATAGADCRAKDLSGPELSDEDVDLLIHYTSLLAVPSRRHFSGQVPLSIDAADLAVEQTMQANVARGATLFDQIRCSACHLAALTTGTHRFAELRQQTIHPYTDLLLHDMGADLADTYPQGVASQQEWRTAPLWGVGLQQGINPNACFLHDGRARTLEEAVPWHGGEAAASRSRFMALSVSDRQLLLDFIGSI